MIRCGMRDRRWSRLQTTFFLKSSVRGQWNLVAIRTALETAGEIFLEGGQSLKWREGPNGAENTDHRLDRESRIDAQL